MPLHVAFYSNQLCLRGTTVALYDYAVGNEEELGNTSIIAYRGSSPNNDASVIDKFERRFTRVHGIHDFRELDELGCDVVYCIKGGHDEGDPPIKTRLCVHCVFLVQPLPRATMAAIAPWVRGATAVVPHMVRDMGPTTDDFRRLHGIPATATVFGRYGGYGEFNIPWVQRQIIEVANCCAQGSRPAARFANIYFVFVNTEPFARASNIIFLPKIVATEEKAAFIDACDAMIWARAEGEVFSLAMGEFSSRNKPVMCCQTPTMDNIGHIHLLKHRAIIYTEDTLTRLLQTFDRTAAALGDWNAYRAYTPAAVMEQFRRVFLS